VEVLGKRIPLDRVFQRGAADARTIARASGGYLRDLLRIARTALTEGSGKKPYPISRETLEGIVERTASQAAGALTVENSTVLRAVTEKPVPFTPSEEQRRLVYELLREPLLLRYLNDSYADLAHPFVLHSLRWDLFRSRVFPERPPAKQP